MKWNKFSKDNIPIFGKHCLVVIKDKNTGEVSKYATHFLTKGTWAVNKHLEVTHWMYLDDIPPPTE